MIKSPALECLECGQVARFATLDPEKNTVTHNCNRCGDEYFITSLDTDYHREAV